MASLSLRSCRAGGRWGLDNVGMRQPAAWLSTWRLCAKCPFGTGHDGDRDQILPLRSSEGGRCQVPVDRKDVISPAGIVSPLQGINQGLSQQLAAGRWPGNVTLSQFTGLCVPGGAGGAAAGTAGPRATLGHAVTALGPAP